ncbi:SHOCT domain-containing protein [Hymenobacter yonginensis]|uniref:SHOCT domain-containing protein n=1 Tax=Hymenobacter yonginensis TaxID=748197 RepID=A0ABY7PJI6_9BACT|nr:SHOCT domain-containing protein [Hymenobacter yonginensis]WBO83432.1 SHOCT domain-containing protein [Hymenobacter yonginensis]
MEKDSSTFETLRQLKEWLDSGIITPQEFTTLKQKLLSGESAAPTPEATQPPVAPAPPAFEPTTVSPVADPLLPPVTHHAAPEPVVPMPPMPASPAEPLSRPIVAGRPEASPSVPAAAQYSVPAPGYEQEQVEDVEDMPYVAPQKSPLSTILIVGGILALLALVAYLMLGNQESERLTSTSRTAADSLAVTPEEGPQAEQIDLPPAAVPETVRVAPALPPAAAPTNPDTAEEAPVEVPAETAPAMSDNAATARAQQVLESYYADLQAAPFSAGQHFAPTVERFYTLSGTTPAAIEAELNRTHFPEFTEAESRIEPGSLQVSPAVSDGSRVVTYRERSTAFRQSMQKRQQTAAQVRVRLDKNFRIIYLRQEKLLENTFTD